MDLSLLGAGFPHTNLRHLPVPFPIIPSLSLSTPSTTTWRSAKRNSPPKTAAATTTITLREEPPNNVRNKNGNGSVTGVHKRRHSKSYLERQSAILEIQQASDLGPAIARLFTLSRLVLFMKISLCNSSCAHSFYTPTTI